MPKCTQITPFVNKTYEMISESNFREIISWSEDGDSFIIWKPQKFRKKIIPLYFKHNNLCSFIRQLNTYGFNKVNRSKKDDPNQVTNFENFQDILEFRHSHFKKGRKDLLSNITRKKIKNTKSESTQKDSSPETNENSAKFSPVPSPSVPLCQKDIGLQQKNAFDFPNFSFASISSHSSFSSASSAPSSPEMAPINIRGYSPVPSCSSPDNCLNNNISTLLCYENEKFKYIEERNKLSKTITYLSLQVQQLSEELKHSQAKIKELEGDLLVANCQYSLGEYNCYKRRRLSPYPESLIAYHPEFQSYIRIQDQFAGLS